MTSQHAFRPGRRRPIRLAMIAGVVVLVSASCALVPLPLPVRGASPGNASPPCAAAAMRSCALPYPSDEFTVADPTTATGRRVDMPDGLIPAGLANALGPGATPADAFRGADGFAALTPVIFELDRSIDPNTLPADGGDIVKVFDVASGQPVPIRAEMSIDAIRHGGTNTILMAWPKLRWDYGHTYVARVHRGLRADVGDLVAAPGVTTPGEYLAGVRSQLESIEGDHWSDVISATRFSIRSQANATGDLEEMARLARAADHPFRDITVSPPAFATNASAIVQGEVRISDFRDSSGVASPENGPSPLWVRFFMVLPDRAAGPDGAPVVVYGHGLTAAKETLLVVASDNAAHGMATVGIDVPNHGDRQADSGGYLLDLANPGAFGRLASMPLEGIVDNVSMIAAVAQHFGDLHVDAWNPVLGTTPPALDSGRILYEGTSMGSVLGAAEVALSPELKGAFLQVGGSGTADIIFHSLLWPLFAPVIPDGSSAGDAAALQGAATMLLDRSDNVNELDRLAKSTVPVVLQYGVGDHVVPNDTSDRLMTLSGLPLIGPDLETPTTSVTRLATDRIPADGRAAEQTWNSSSSFDTLSFQAHLSFTDPTAVILFEPVAREPGRGDGSPRRLSGRRPTDPADSDSSAASPTVAPRDPPGRLRRRGQPSRPSAFRRHLAHRLGR